MNAFTTKDNAVQRSLDAGVSGATAKAAGGKRAADRAAESAAFVNEQLARASAEAIELDALASAEALVAIRKMERSKHTFSSTTSFSREVREVFATLNAERSADKQLRIDSEALARLHEAYDVAMLRDFADADHTDYHAPIHEDYKTAMLRYFDDRMERL